MTNANDIGTSEQSWFRIMLDRNHDAPYQRYGQYFVNKYITHSWPKLYYAEDSKSYGMVAEWLKNHQYEYDMPPLRKEDSNVRTMPSGKY